MVPYRLSMVKHILWFSLPFLNSLHVPLLQAPQSFQCKHSDPGNATPSIPLSSYLLVSRHTGNDVTLLPLITFFTMYLSLCTSLNKTVCSCAVILVDCTGIASTGVGSHGCMPLHLLYCERPS